MTTKLVTFFHPLFSDGGVERTNIYQAKGLIQRGYRVEFLTTCATDHYREEVDEAGIQIVDLGPGRAMRLIPKVRKYLASAAARYESVYFISCQYYVNLSSMIVAMLFGRHLKTVKFINSERNHFEEFAFRKGIKNRLIPIAVRHLYRFADLVIANSQETARDLSRFIARDVHAVYNPTINDRIDNLSIEPISEGWFLSDERPCVIAVGRLSMQKDFTTLIRAFRLVRDKMNVRLVILGDGEQREALRSEVERLQLQTDVYLPGFAKNPYKFIARSRVFVLSSKYEGLPNALIEAAYLQVPCISTECKSGPREILLDGAGGFLVPIGNHAKMAAAIMAALNDTDSVRQSVHKAFEGTRRFRYAEVSAEFERVINL